MLAAICGFLIATVSATAGWGFAVGTFQAKVDGKYALIEKRLCIMEDWAMRHQELTDKQSEILIGTQKYVETNTRSINRLIEIVDRLVLK